MEKLDMAPSEDDPEVSVLEECGDSPMIITAKKRVWSGRCCVAWNCSNRTGNRSVDPLHRDVDISFHRFPANQELRGQWVIALRRQNFIPSSSSRICSQHFKESDFAKTGTQRSLKKHAVPSIFDFSFQDELFAHSPENRISSKTESSDEVCFKSESTSSYMDVDNITQSGGDSSTRKTSGGASQEKRVQEISFDSELGSILVSTNYKIDPTAIIKTEPDATAAPAPNVQKSLVTQNNFNKDSSTSSLTTTVSSQSALDWSKIPLPSSNVPTGVVNNPITISNSDSNPKLSTDSTMEPKSVPAEIGHNQYQVIITPSQLNKVLKTQNNSTSISSSTSSPSSSTLPLSSSQPTLEKSEPALKKRKVEAETTNPTPDSINEAPSEQLISQIPRMNSMVRYQLQRLLKSHEEMKRKFPRSVNLNRPVAVLTAYSAKRIPSNNSLQYALSGIPATISHSHGSKLYHKIPRRVFFGNFLPVVCEHLSAIIHLDKLFCPGTYRPCVEFEGTLITPLNLLQKAGFTYTANWEAIFRVGGGKSVKMLFDNSKLNFTDHDNFCSGRCQTHSSAQHSSSSKGTTLTSGES